MNEREKKIENKVREREKKGNKTVVELIFCMYELKLCGIKYYSMNLFEWKEIKTPNQMTKNAIKRKEKNKCKNKRDKEKERERARERDGLRE